MMQPCRASERSACPIVLPFRASSRPSGLGAIKAASRASSRCHGSGFSHVTYCGKFLNLRWVDSQRLADLANRAELWLGATELRVHDRLRADLRLRGQVLDADELRVPMLA